MLKNKLSHYWNRAYQSDTVRKTVTLISGTVIAQAVPVLISPVLTRMYSPESFGALDLFLSITTILTVIASLRIEVTIVLPKERLEGVRLTQISSIICLLFSIFLLICCVPAYYGYRWLHIDPLFRPYLWLIPLMVLLTGWNNALRAYCLRAKNYKSIAYTTAIKVTAGSIVHLIGGWFYPTPFSLITGQLTSGATGNYALWKTFAKDRAEFIDKRKGWGERTKELWQLLKRYAAFPLYGAPGALFNVLLVFLPGIFISGMYSLEDLGYVALTNRVLQVPMRLIGNALTDVFLQQSAVEYQTNGHLRNTFPKLFRILLIISIIFIVAGCLAFGAFFPWIFGPKWKDAGLYAVILTPLYGIRFAVSPLSNVFTIFSKQRLWLGLMGSQMAVLLITIIIVVLNHYSILTYLVLYSVLQSLFYLFYGYLSWQIAKGKL